MKKDIFNLEQDQFIIIEKIKYKILNKVKFTEKSSYWIEYKMQKVDDNYIYYLNVELSSKLTIYKVLQEKNVSVKMNMIFEGEEYELFEKGIGKVETYYGMTDVGIKEEVNYYEYTNKINQNKILSIEKWKNETEVSIGKIIKISDIKILKEFDV
ncbi:MAG: DUF4178 domain-containing protein [Clostridia bacterium]|nr:DUF4178 domain-containing protein [Clostridia bacterium]